MRNCLNDKEISAFVDGNIENKEEAIHHLNSCADCFEQVTTVMNLIDENQKSYEQLNSAYENMALKQGFVSYFDAIKSKFANFIDDLLPSPGGSNTVSGFVLNRYSAIGATLIFAIFAVNIIQQASKTQFSVFEIAKEYSIEYVRKELNTDSPVKVRGVQSELADNNNEFDGEPDKKNAFEIGNNIMKIDAILASGNQEDTKKYFDNIFSNPLLKKEIDKQKGFARAEGIENLKKQTDSVISGIDPKLLPYIKYGMLVELAKYESKTPTQKNSKVEEIIIDLKKSDDYFKDSEKLTELLK